MNKKRIEFILLDQSVINLQQDTVETYFMIDTYRAIVPPHHTSHHFMGEDMFSFFIDTINDIGVGIISSYLFDLIKSKKICNLKINGKKVNTNQEIQKALQNE